MKDRTYEKVCDAGKLTAELVAAGILQHPADGFKMFGVSFDEAGPLTTVHVIDNLSVDDSAAIDDVVAAHELLTVADAKTAAIESLRTAVSTYLFQHYNQGTQNSMLAAWTEAVKASPPWSNRQALVQSVWDWIKTVLTYYAQKASAIRAATTVDEVNSVTWDFAPYNNSDPDVSLTAVLSTTD